MEPKLIDPQNFDPATSVTPCPGFNLLHPPADLKPVNPNLEVSIVMPTVNTPTFPTAIRCLVRNTPILTKVGELIVVADACTPDFHQLLQTWKESGVIQKLVLNNDIVGSSRACNQGILEAEGKYIGLVASDVYVPPYWLPPLLMALEYCPEYGWVTPRWYTNDQVQGPFTSCNCGFFTRESLLKVGLFDERYGGLDRCGYDDDDLYIRFRLAGYYPHGIVNTTVLHGVRVTQDRIHGREGFNQLLEHTRRSQQVLLEKWGVAGTYWSLIPTAYMVEVYDESAPVDRFDWLRRNAEGRILDIGSAGGHTYKGNEEAYNLDVDLYMIPRFVRGDAHHLPFRNDSFDTATIGDVLEHVDNPVQVLKEAKRVAKKVLLTVPNEAETTRELLNKKSYIPYLSKDEETYNKQVEQWIRDNKPAAILDDKKHRHLFHKTYYDSSTLESHLQEADLKFTIEHLNYSMLKPDGTLNHLSFFLVTAK